jgi:hypothetical protein
MSTDAAVVEAAYRVLAHYLPTQSAGLDAQYAEATALIPDGRAKTKGQAAGLRAAEKLIRQRAGDGLVTPIGSTSPFTPLAPGPGVWRLTPPFAAPQVPWVGDVEPFVLGDVDRFMPPPPPSLSSPQWVAAFDEVKAHGSNTNPNVAETTTAWFYTANVIRQFSRMGRELADAKGLGDVDTARLLAMISVVGADQGIAAIHAKYHLLFWRPVTAIDPTAIKPGGDGFGPTPGFDDGNPLTVEEPGWRPLIATPNHPEYPSAHGTLTSSEAEVVTAFLGTGRIDLDLHGFDPTGLPGNFDATRHFDTAAALRADVVNGRTWGGMHYRFSTEAGVAMGRQIARYDLAKAFGEDDDD